MSLINPFQIIPPSERWAPSQSQIDAFQNKYEMLLPPLVYKIRLAVAKWRGEDYNGASETSKSLLNFWFNQEHLLGQTSFSFFFSQREAIESIIYLYEVANAKDKYELMKFDSSGRISTGMFDETWTRYVIKMATGAGKTKVMGLTLVWSYFHKLYEIDSKLSKDFLVIAPNIIVLNRLRKDFDGLKMFFEEPFIPENGYADLDWKNDFQLTLHIQDELKPITESGNIFLTNIHRVFFNEEPEETLETTFLGVKPKPNADISRGMDLGKVLRSSKIKDLVVLNDEAHHVRKDTQWFNNIEQISNKLKLKNNNGISLQADFSATPRKNDGSIFVQTISDFPLVEAIKHNVVKSIVVPDNESRQKLIEVDSTDFIERYKDFIELGYVEWKKQYETFNHIKSPLLFIMTNNTAEADIASKYLQTNFIEFKNAVLTIHTNNKGEIAETTTSKKSKDELELLRKAADDVDKDHSPYKAIVSVLMLREGWDVKNVTTIVGLRKYGATSEILPEQTIGRGLRKMFSLQDKEYLSVIGTPKFMEFVDKLKEEGVTFSESPMGKDKKGTQSIVLEIDSKKTSEQLQKLNILIPVLTPRYFHEYKNLALINENNFEFKKHKYNQYTIGELKEIVFHDIDDKITHTTTYSETFPDYRNVLGFYTKSIMRKSKLFSGFDILYPKIENFIKTLLFDTVVDLANPITIKNISNVVVKDELFAAFKKAIDVLTFSENEIVASNNYQSLLDTSYKIIDGNSISYYPNPKKSVFNYAVGDNRFEIDMASYLETIFNDVTSFAKNTMGESGVNFSIEYQKEDGTIASYFPDFFVKTNENTFFILETKGREDLDDIRKIKRLATWCNDINAIQTDYTYTPIYVKQEKWDDVKKDIKTFAELCQLFEVK